MKKTVIAATAAALLASVTFGIAASGPQPHGPRTDERSRPSPEQMAENAGAMADARIAALKAGLRMTTEQEKLWPALETALRAASDERIERRKEWREERAERRGPPAPGEARAARPDAIEGLSERADAMLERGAALKSVADAAKPLYQSLDEAQQRRFNLLFRDARGEKRMAFNQRGHDRHGWQRDGRGPHGFGPHGFGPGGKPDGHRAPPPPQGEKL